MHRIIISTILLLVIFIFFYLSSPFSFRDTHNEWKFKDLRIYDPLDSDQANNELIAVYSRRIKDSIEFRMDLLDVSPNTEYFYELSSLNNQLNPIWTATIRKDASPSFTIFDGEFVNTELSPTIFIDPIMDFVVLRFNQNIVDQITREAKFQLQIIDPSTDKVLDSSQVFTETQHQTRQSPLLMEFWNTLPAETPSQLLRSWDGAHSGPFGQRHGLKFLIENSNIYQIPITLLDLKTTHSFLGLTLLSQVDHIQQSEEEGTLSLPISDFSDSRISSYFLEQLQKEARSFGFQSNSSIFGLSTTINPFQSRLVYSQLVDTSHIFQIKNNRYVPLPLSFPYSSSKISTNFLVMNSVFDETVKQQLLIPALTSDPNDLVIFGDDLRDSPWADAQLAPILFKYISTHPWIDTLDTLDLWNINSISISSQKLPLVCKEHLICPQIQVSDDRKSINTQLSGLKPFQELNSFLEHNNPSTNLAIDLLNRINDPTKEPDDLKEEQNAIGNIDILLASEAWFNNPYQSSTCEMDFGHDNNFECVISTSDIFLVADPDEGNIKFAMGKVSDDAMFFAITPDYVYPRNREISLPTGIQVLNGALSDPSGMNNQYSFRLDGNQISFISSDGSIEKIITLENSGINIRIYTNTPYHTLISTMHTMNTVSNIDCLSQIDLCVESLAPRIELHQGEMASYSYLDSFDLLAKSEDPNFDYPPGHYLPIPFSVVEITGTNLIDLSLLFPKYEN
jgi:hypothetical protein